MTINARENPALLARTCDRVILYTSPRQILASYTKAKEGDKTNDRDVCIKNTSYCNNSFKSKATIADKKGSKEQ